MRLHSNRPKRSTPRIKRAFLPKLGFKPGIRTTKFNPYYVIPLLVISSSLVLWTKLQITSIDCLSSNTLDCSPNAYAIAQQYLGKRVFAIDPKLIEKNIIQALPEYEQVAVRVSLPGTLEVRLSLSEPLVQITTASESAALLVNTNYVMTEYLPSPRSDLFTITSQTTLKPEVGTYISDPALVGSIKLYALLRDRNIPIESMTIISPQRIEVQSRQLTLLFTSFKSLEDQVTSLQIILGTDTIESDIHSIDLRPERPVLR